MDSTVFISALLVVVSLIVLIAMVSFGLVPSLLAAVQFALIPLHRDRHAHLDRTAPYFPRTAVVIPAWNEAEALKVSVPHLMDLEYPEDRLRVVIVDDASDDSTPEVVDDLERRYPGRIRCIRRESGGEGKATTLNAGLTEVLCDDWAQAILITDADVIFTPDALHKMSRHLADPEVGAVTCYIKEGSADNHWLSRYIAFEYAVAQAGARRALNVLGIQACLAGGGQLHSRESFDAIGSRIDTTTLAEDTVTTFRTRGEGRRVIFEGNAVVWAEEPASITSLWKQRMRWSRGNLQITRMFSSTWFRREKNHRYLPKFLFDAIWFSLLLMPLTTIGATASLLYLFFHSSALAWAIFRHCAYIATVCWAFLILTGMALDPQTTKRSWSQAVRYPGLMTLGIILAASFSRQASWLFYTAIPDVTGTHLMPSPHWLVFFAYCWLTLAMVGAWVAKLLDRRDVPVLPRLLLGLCGYGSLQLAVSAGAWLREIGNAPRTWDKTEKAGTVAVGV